jgi:general stress protein 26
VAGSHGSTHRRNERADPAIVDQESGGVDYLFHTNTESGKTDDLASDSHVNISFLTYNGSWASISGTASVETDRATVKKYYTPTLKTWVGDQGDGVHDGSENDPRIGVIKVKAVTATYALPKGTPLGRGVEMIKGAITGETADVTQLREINEQEISQWRSSH